MYVPNYIPPPIEVPNNVTEERYLVRLGFVRRVSLLHFLSLISIAGLANLNLPKLDVPTGAAGVGIILLLLSIVRIATRATRMDLVLSLTLLPFLLVATATLARSIQLTGWPVWGILVGSGFSAVYALCCGRDFSFVGQFFLSFITSSVALAILATTYHLTPTRASFLLGANALYLSYLVYDSASLLARRRLGEELGAVVDLYRDVFNIFGYLLRIARHWRKHRIWAR